MDFLQSVDSHLEKATPQEMLEILRNTLVDKFGNILLCAIENKKFGDHGKDIDHVLEMMEHLTLSM